MRHLLIVSLTVLSYALLSTEAHSRTIIQMLETDCPNHDALKSAETASAEARAMSDPNASDLEREAARQYYRCAQNAPNPYAHDWAMYWYAVDIDDATSPKDQGALPIFSQAQSVQQRLIATSHYADVRNAAAGEIKILKLAIQMATFCTLHPDAC
jgi:hypothetical protein